MRHGHLFHLYLQWRCRPLHLPPRQPLDGRAHTCLHPTGHLLRFGKSLFHTDYGLGRGHLCPVQGQAPRQAGTGWHRAQPAYLPVPCPVRRGLQQHQLATQRQNRSRLEPDIEQLALLRTVPSAHTLYCLGTAHQGVCHQRHQWRRRLWRYVCTIAIHRMLCRFLLLQNVEHA